MDRTAEEVDLVLEAIKHFSNIQVRPYFSIIAEHLRTNRIIEPSRTIKLLKILVLQDKVKEFVCNGLSYYKLNDKQYYENTMREEMNVSSSIVSEVLTQLCRTNERLKIVGVTESQLQAALIWKLGRGTNPSFSKLLVDKEIELKNIIKNQFGNYIMNSVNPTDLLCEEDSLSDSDSPETRESDSTTTERTIDSLDIPDSLKSEDNSMSKFESKKSDEILIEIDQKQLDKPDQERLSPCRSEESIINSSRDNIEKSGQCKRKKSKSKADEDYRPDCNSPSDRSPSPEASNVAIEQRIILSKNTGRRIIRKKTKYDPSEFYLTPLVRKKKEVVSDIPKVKLKRGRPPFKHLKPGLSSNAPKKSDQIKEKLKKTDLEIKESNAELTKSVVHKSDACFDTREEPFQSKASSLKDQCYICSEYADINDKVLTYSCSLCLNIAHKDCVVIDGVANILKKWRCKDCLNSNPVVCSVCDKEYMRMGGVMLMCDFCEEFYHATCHDPPVKLPRTDTTWRCSLCPNITYTDILVGGREDLRSRVGTYAFNSASTSIQPFSVKIEPEELDETPSSCELQNPDLTSLVPTDFQPKEIKEELESFDVKIKEENCEEEYTEDSEIAESNSFKFHQPTEPIPRVVDWTAKQVSEYFTEKFGAIVGNAFLSQEIDGSSLMLMNREDVTEQLGLHFGVALKVLYYVKKIQLGTNAYCKLWA